METHLEEELKIDKGNLILKELTISIEKKMRKAFSHFLTH